MSLPDYETVAKFVGVRLCSVSPSPRHEHGYTTGLVVHWTDRRPTRSGIRRFLMLCSQVKVVRDDDPDWYYLWRRIQWTRAAAAEIHVRIPPGYWAEDQARLAGRLTGLALPSALRKEGERALRWARRRPRR